MEERVSQMLDLLNEELGCDNEEVAEFADWFRERDSLDLVWPSGSIVVIAATIKRIFGN
jgi:hypothetical protein